MDHYKKPTERRSKTRFQMDREVRYKATGEGAPPATGAGRTMNMCSAGVAFSAEHYLLPGTFVELSIEWPVLLDQTCPMRLIVFGRVLRSTAQTAVCTIDKYEFRTARRSVQPVPVERTDGMLQRWAESMRKTAVLKENMAGA